MRLTDPWFDAHFFGYVAGDVGRRTSRHAHEDGRPLTFDEAQGVAFWCPCGVNARDDRGELLYPLDLSLNKGRPHLAEVPFTGRGLPDDFGPRSRNNPNEHPRWSVSGSSLEDLSCSPSISVGDPECWHGYITNGEVT